MTILQGTTRKSTSINNDHVPHLMTITEIIIVAEIEAVEEAVVMPPTKNLKNEDLQTKAEELLDHQVLRRLKSENIIIITSKKHAILLCLISF